jgi:hypothetical protein
MVDLDAPLRVTAGGGLLFYDDDQKTPDTMVVSFDFAKTCVVWEHRIWSRTGIEGGESWGVTMYGEKGTLVFNSKGWHVIDGGNDSEKAVEMEKPHWRDAPPEVPVEVPTPPGAVSGPQFPPDLARVVAAWNRLPEAIKAGVLALVQAAGGPNG